MTIVVVLVVLVVAALATWARSSAARTGGVHDRPHRRRDAVPGVSWSSGDGGVVRRLSRG